MTYAARARLGLGRGADAQQLTTDGPPPRFRKKATRSQECQNCIFPHAGVIALASVRKLGHGSCFMSEDTSTVRFKNIDYPHRTAVRLWVRSQLSAYLVRKRHQVYPLQPVISTSHGRGHTFTRGTCGLPLLF